MYSMRKYWFKRNSKSVRVIESSSYRVYSMRKYWFKGNSKSVRVIESSSYRVYSMIKVLVQEEFEIGSSY